MTRPRGAMEDWETPMSEWFVLWSASMGGWFTKSSTYTSDLAQARLMSKEEAFATCRTHLTMQGDYGMIPVRLDDLKEVRNA